MDSEIYNEVTIVSIDKMIYHTIFEIRYSHSNYPSEFLVQQKSTPFWSSQCHLVSWAKSYVCCVNPTYSALWFEAPVTI